jgi:hypothetical protein
MICYILKYNFDYSVGSFQLLIFFYDFFLLLYIPNFVQSYKNNIEYPIVILISVVGMIILLRTTDL